VSRCKFDPTVLICKGPATTSSLSNGAQVEAARKIYAGPKNPRTGEEIYSPCIPAAAWWGQLAGGDQPSGFP